MMGEYLTIGAVLVTAIATIALAIATWRQWREGRGNRVVDLINARLDEVGERADQAHAQLRSEMTEGFRQVHSRVDDIYRDLIRGK